MNYKIQTFNYGAYHTSYFHAPPPRPPVSCSLFILADQEDCSKKFAKRRTIKNWNVYSGSVMKKLSNQIDPNQTS